MRAGILPKCDAMSKRKFTKKKHALNKKLTTFPQQDFALHNGPKSCQRREMGVVWPECGLRFPQGSFQQGLPSIHGSAVGGSSS